MRLHEYLRKRQLARAEHLLRTTPLSIEDVAAASAFGTAWAFYRHFKAAYGTTPGAYRQIVSRTNDAQ
jgi:AraC family transcriptional regulator of arabinose operon